MKKILLIMIMTYSGLFSQDTTPAEQKNIIEKKTYYDEAKTKLKIVTSHYLKGANEIAHGVFKSYYENGQIFTERTFADGLQDGPETRYAKDGTKESMSVWKKGQVVKDVIFYLDGVIRAETELKVITVRNQDPTKPDVSKPIKHGLETIYYKSGKPKIKMNWADDKQEGLETYFHENGNKKYELNWKDGKKNGVYTIWFKEGTISTTINYVDDQEQGEMVNYHENGQKKDQIIWDKGQIVGERLSWNDKGTVIGKCTFKDGKPFTGTLFDIEKEFLLFFENGKQVDTKLCDRNGVLK